MTLTPLEATIIRALNEQPRRQVYEGCDGRWHITYQGPDIQASAVAIAAMEKRGILKLEYPGFYRLGDAHVRPPLREGGGSNEN